MKRWLSLFLALVMLVTMGIVPVASAVSQEAERVDYIFTEADNRAIEEDVFDKISLVEQSAAKTKGGIERMTEQDYIRLVPQVIQAIEASSTYQKGTLQQNGNFLVWQTTVGIPCCYDPRMEAELHNTVNKPTPAEVRETELAAEELAEILEDSVCGGYPSAPHIGLIQPYYESSSNYADSSFVTYSPAYKTMWTELNKATGGEGLRYTMYNATVDNIAHAMEECGLVIFDSHGTTDYSGYNYDYTSRANCSYLCLITNTGITSADTAPQNGPYGTYYYCIKGSNYAYISGTCIANHMTKDAPNSLLYMGICLSMATDGMFKGLQDRGVETFWGYSQSVTFSGERTYMQAILGNLKKGDDFATAVSKAKKQYGNWDPAYSNLTESQARSERVAFPICVSSEDEYPGHGNVDKVWDVNSTWTLFSQYTVSAISNNEEWGTVSVSGNKITAIPADGYYSAGYEVVEGSAQVAQNEDVFVVTPESDCTIRILFAPKPQGVVHFIVPDGMVCGDSSGYFGEEIVLPEPDGKPTANAHQYRFLGWVSEELKADTTALPVYQKPGSTFHVTEEETTLYALFTYFISENGVDGDQFVRVTKEPASWDGRYVIAYEDQKALDASGSVVGTAIGSSKAVVDLDEIGCVVENQVLQNVPESLMYEIAPSENGAYTVKMLSQNCFLALSANTDSLTSFYSSNTNKTRWLLSMTANGPVLANAQYPARTLQYHTEREAFSCFQTTQTPITLYRAFDGTSWYATELQDKPVCVNHVFGAWIVEAAPTCVDSGLQYRVCETCGTVEREELAALGHDYAEDVTPPTCTEGGYSTFTCTRCGDSYTDNYTEALGHTYGEPVWNWNEDLTAATATFTCDCGDEQVLDAEITEEIVTEAVPHIAGEKKLIATVTFNGEDYTDDKTVEIPALPCPCEQFTDMPAYGTVEHDAIDWAFAHKPYGITAGISDTLFGTGNTVTRAQAMTFLWTAKDRPEHSDIANPFEDVPEGKWFTDAVLWAVEFGVTGGTTPTTFSPNQTCNRAQIITFLYAAMGKPETTIENPYSDVDDHYYKDPAIWAYENGIERGEDGMFNGKTECTRAMIVTYLYRFFTGKGLAE